MSMGQMFARGFAGFAFFVLITGCGSGSNNTQSTSPILSVSVSPESVTLTAGGTQAFAAAVTNDSANAGVTWSTSVGSITTGGMYTAPVPVTAATATITVTSRTDPAKAASATVSLTPISVSVGPGSATLIGGATQTFTATVTGDTALNEGVTWFV